ncbi:MAG TPA: hypothetical protein VF507_05250 [Pyrinomonadaceae bacterium]
MKAVITGKLLMPAAIAFVAPFVSMTLIAGAHDAALTRGGQDDLLLILLALGGVAAGIVNGFGRGAGKSFRVTPSRAKNNHAGPRSSALKLGC